MQLSLSADPVRPLLKWAGSKKKLVPRLSNYWDPRFGKYIEPFFGSGALYFSIRPSCAVLGDLNADLIDMYVTLRDRVEDVYEQLLHIPANKENFLLLRGMHPRSLTPVQRCVRFVYLNRYCFNGLYRTNRSAQFNVPFSGKRAGTMPSFDEFLAVAEQLKHAQLQAGDFADVVRVSASQGDFVYMDPPYAVSNARVFKQYGPDVFGTEDLVRLRDLLVDLDERGVWFVLSYASCEEAHKLFREWQTEAVEVGRNIAGFAKHRRIVPEVIYSNCQNIARQRQ